MTDKKPENYSVSQFNNPKKKPQEIYPKLTIIKPLQKDKKSLYDQMKLELIELANQFYDHNMKTIIVSVFLSVNRENLICDYLIASYTNDQLQPFETEKNKLEKIKFNSFLNEN